MSQLDINKPNLQVIDASNIIHPESPIYSYSIWIYFKSLPGTSGGGGILYRGNGSYVETNIFVDNSNNLKYTTYNNKNSSQSNPSAYNYINVTNTPLPIQKWINIILSVSTSSQDCYINGKLVLTTPATNYTTDPSRYKSTPIKFGANNQDKALPAVISNIQRWSKNLSPQEAWNVYLAGNGPTSWFPGTNITASILQNNIVTSRYVIY